MAASSTDHFLSTYARVIFSEWQALARWAMEYTAAPNTSLDESVAPFSLLSQTQIEDTLRGPLSAFFQQKLTAFAGLQRMQLEHNIQNEPFKWTKYNSRQSEFPAQWLDQVLPNHVQELQQQLNEMAQQHYQQWQAFHQEWTEAIIQELKALGHVLTDMEIQDVRDIEVPSRLINRFTELNLPLPKTKKLTATWHSYLTLRTSLVIHSELSRTQKSNTFTEVEKVMKNLKNIFASLEKAENQLYTGQNNEIQHLLGGLMTANNY